ncbi:MAG: hypothetical protein AVDCRST_MAG25-633 [uncultured Rubrobacteraceae bacterium]|uniref:Uncharacterized protein n=1 Tax=uncultured Rubrobacteraceae bacterium TaxID=349277 RepID=A0A6J4R0Q7_9ACTN|nr:MAG: hypothetical protein AVDCRST_MAG25-633 [uncultured Rubrobacteraceae bacterium]
MLLRPRAAGGGDRTAAMEATISRQGPLVRAEIDVEDPGAVAGMPRS